ncbi:MAG: DUF3493 domain-containing protein [Sphaerospermopsis sp. SIO1G2]|nr:DUF3493 domain-containing protein [Sphaerospermopsis sp. SIO1G1]NET70636.1 DUF3493 domain-containing protein [Sphaerospermopsis sp. SIO1G2]
MADPKLKNRLNSQQYARLKAEINSPYRGFRKFIYFGVGTSALIGAFVFFFQILAGRNLGSALPNFALQTGVVALMVFLWKWEQKTKNATKTDN